jgi:mono/diheme cytochrome c family protein
MVRNFVLGFVGMIALLIAGSWSYLRLGLADVPADVNPSAMESRLMHFAVHAAVRHNAPKTQNPFPPTDENLIAGGILYVNGCAGCHGQPGKSPGEDEPEYSRPPKFARDASPYSEPEMFWVIQHGVRRTGMSAYGPFYSEKEMWNLAAFVKRMQDLSPAVLQGIHSKKP